MGRAQDDSAMAPPRERCRVRVEGVVQGVGFRPYVSALARSLGLAGEVWNTGNGVTCEVEGEPGAVATFVARIGPEAPPLAVVVAFTESQRSVRRGTEFTIAGTVGARGRTFVSPDVAICDDCLDDLSDPLNRRHRRARPRRAGPTVPSGRGVTSCA